MNTSNYDDVINSRDIIEELNIIESRLEDFLADGGVEEDFDEIEDLKTLREWNALGDDVDDWDYGATLIRDSYFEEYAEQLCEDLGEIPDDLPGYIACHIDWEGVARDMKMDYQSIELSGQTYWVR